MNIGEGRTGRLCKPEKRKIEGKIKRKWIYEAMHSLRGYKMKENKKRETMR